jgi:hypothetical protein
MQSVGNALRGVPLGRERVQQMRNGTEAVPYRKSDDIIKSENALTA